MRAAVIFLNACGVACPHMFDDSPDERERCTHPHIMRENSGRPRAIIIYDLKFPFWCPLLKVNDYANRKAS